MYIGSTQITDRVLIGGAIGLFIIVLLLIGIINDITVKVKQLLQRLKGPPDDEDHAATDILIFIYLNIFLILLHMISLLFRYVYPLTNSDCRTISTICLVLFHLTRTIQYVIFVRRIQVIYSGTIFDLRKKYIYILYSFIAVYALPYIFYFNWTFMFRSTYTDDFGCSMRFHAALFFPQSFFDIFISLCGLYLFIFPLRSLIQHQEDDELQNQIYNILIKYCLLYGTTIGSSLVLIVISFLFPFGFYYAIIDGLFNAMMLILLAPEHNTCYKRICHVCRTGCIECCNAYAVYKKEQIIKLNAQLQSNSEEAKSKSPSRRFKVPEIRVFFEIDTVNIVTDLKIETPLDVILTRSNARVDPNLKNTVPKSGDLSAISEATEQNTATTSGLEDDYMPRSLSNMYKQAAKKKPSFKEVTEEPPKKLKSPRRFAPKKTPKKYKMRSNSEPATPDDQPKFITIAIDKALSLKSLRKLTEDQELEDDHTDVALSDHLDLNSCHTSPKRMHPSKSTSHESNASGDSVLSGMTLSQPSIQRGAGLHSITNSHRLDVRQHTNSMSRSMNTLRLITYEANNL